MQNLISQNYSQYLNFLKNLVNLRSEFTNPDDTRKAIEYCKSILQENLPHYKIYFDKEHNLIALPPQIDTKKDITYLSAHIDTVGAKPEEWEEPYQPWKAYEDENEIIGRGAKDCKAGVAYQLLISHLAKQNLIQLDNLIFTITFKEEGAGKKTATEIAKNFGTELPLSQTSTYLIVLENNVKVETTPTLCIYASERSNYVAEIIDFIPQLQNHLKKLEKWNPASITPQTETKDIKWQSTTQTGGHMCSVSKEENKLTQAILNANENSIIKAGKKESFAVVPTEILTSNSPSPIKHSLVLSNRSFDSLQDALKQLEGIEYEPVKDFTASEGFNIEEKFLQNHIAKVCDKCSNTSTINIEHTFNVGGSDATTIYTTLAPQIRKNFYPIVMGPGSRSQRGATPPRLTHGKNETFDKKSGEQAVKFIFEVLRNLGHIR